MNHVTNHSPGNKVFKICFTIFMMIATVIIYTGHCGNSIAKESGEEIKKHDVITDVQIDKFTAGVSDILDSDVLESEVISGKFPHNLAISQNMVDTNILVQEDKIEHTEEVKKEYSYYYIDDKGHKSFLNEQYQDYLYEMCVKYNVKKYYTLFLAQMYHESTFRTDAISKTKDYGLMQINVYNHKWLSKKLGNDNFLDPYNNIEAGIYMMSNYLHKYNDVEKALVCYNEGEGAVINGTHSTSYSKGVLHDTTLLIELN